MARKPARTAAGDGRTVISSPGSRPVSFQRGGLHESLGVPAGQKIPAGKMTAAAAGKYGAKARKQAVFAEGMLKTGRKTAARNRKASRKKG